MTDLKKNTNRSLMRAEPAFQVVVLGIAMILAGSAQAEQTAAGESETISKPVTSTKSGGSIKKPGKSSTSGTSKGGSDMGKSAESKKSPKVVLLKKFAAAFVQTKTAVVVRDETEDKEKAVL